MKTLSVALAALLPGFAIMSFAHPHQHSHSHTHSAAREMADTANHFLAALTPEQRETAVSEFDDDERHD